MSVNRVLPKKKKAAADMPTKRIVRPDSSISLPEKDIIPSDDLLDYTILVYGKKGVGKTSLMAQFPNAIIFNWDFGRRSVKCKQVPKAGEPPLDWARWKDYEEILAADPPDGYVVTDNMMQCWGACVRWYCEKRGIATPSDLAGQQRPGFWSDAKMELIRSFKTLMYAGVKLAFTSHMKKGAFGTRNGDEFNDWEPDCGAAWDMLKEICDIVIFYSYHRTERSFTVRSTELVHASPGPADHFLDPDGKPLIEFPAGDSLKESYETLVKAFNNQVYGYAEEEEE